MTLSLSRSTPLNSTKPFVPSTTPLRITRITQHKHAAMLTPPAALPVEALSTVTALASFVSHPVLAAAEIDWSDPDVQIGAFGAFLGLAMGIGVPIFYVSRDERDDERLEELRALNRATKAETGEYLSDEEIQAIRPKRWTDGREFVDDVRLFV